MNFDRRTSGDRRRRPTPCISRYTFFGGRRVGPRRRGDSPAIYVDRFGFGVALILLLIFVFQCLDAVFTLDHLSRGGRELNPVMEYLLEKGSWVFLATKLGTAGLGLFFLALHKNFRWVRVGIAVLFLLYAGVVGYHVSMY